MLNKPLGFGHSELKKEASRRRIESIRRFQSIVLKTENKSSALDESMLMDRPIKPHHMGSINETMSLSVFNRPRRSTVVEQLFKNFDDNYKTFKLETNSGVLDSRLALENRLKLIAAKIEAEKVTGGKKVQKNE